MARHFTELAMGGTVVVECGAGWVEEGGTHEGGGSGVEA